MSSKKRKKRRPRRSDYAAPQAAVAQPKPKPAAATTRRPQKVDDRPPAPWGSFPLVEIAVLVGIVMLILGLFIEERRGLLIATGLILASIAGLELAIREHFAGFRSHSTLLAGTVALIVLGVLFYAGPESLPPAARFGIGLAVFGAAFYLLTGAFRRRAGVAFKLR